MQDQTAVRIIIIEDDRTIREGYSFLIGETPGYKIANAYSSAEQALKKLAADQPDLVLLDVGLPGMTGIDAISKIKAILPHVQVLMLTVHESEEIVFRALTEGASGYLTKNSPATKIIESIKELMKGGGSMSANIARLVIRSFQKNVNSPLSRRETQILEEIARGKNRRHIADELFIDHETVKSHIKNIYSKLNVHSRADAIRAAREGKLI
ncbi:MAG: response regulator transcription factor [Puia sp.]